MSQVKTVFDMTHVFTQGIMERKVIKQDDDDYMVVETGGWSTDNKKFLPCKDWEVNLDTAIRIAENKKKRKIKLLKKQIEKLESTPIKIVRLGN